MVSRLAYFFWKCVGIVSFKLVRIWENFSTSLARVVTSRVWLAR